MVKNTNNYTADTMEEEKDNTIKVTKDEETPNLLTPGRLKNSKARLEIMRAVIARRKAEIVEGRRQEDQNKDLS